MPTPRALPGLGIYGFWPLGSDSYKDQLDAGLRMLSTLTQLAPLSMSTALPGSPSQGQIYIVPSGGDANKIALYDEGEWVYLTPQEGWRAWVCDLDKLFTFSGSAWVEFASGGSDLPSMTGAAGWVLTVNEEEDGVEWVLFPGVPAYVEGDEGKILRVNLDGTAIEWSEPGSGGGGGIADAPSDGKPYVRKDAAWIEMPSAIQVVSITDDYTIEDSDGGSYLRVDSATAVEILVPANADVPFPIGTVIQLRQSGEGQVTVTGAGGVTVISPETSKLRKLGSSGSLIKVATNIWDLIGDLEVAE